MTRGRAATPTCRPGDSALLGVLLTRNLPSGMGAQGLNKYDLANNTGDHVAPAAMNLVGNNGLYSVYLYGNESIRYITQHDPSVPMFMYLAWNVVHAPCEAPDYYYDLYADTIQNSQRRYFAAMIT